MNGRTADTCIFCKIAQKKIDAKIIDENENAIAFLDAFPLTVGHTLVITKKHYAKLQEVELDQMAYLFNLIHKILPPIEKGTGVQSTLIAIHNGKDAGQVIPHLHVHIVPRKAGDGGGAIHSMFDSSDRLGEYEMNKVLKSIKE
ncbi:MAG TPA: HIT family protein [Nitrososphaeraceae archaeon]|jgi:histidine triad (HIT) family protein|nr:HIT family protein [Nitrososphaeraceae archaeon]